MSKKTRPQPGSSRGRHEIDADEQGDRLSEVVGDDGGGGISAGRTSTRSGAGLGFDPRRPNQKNQESRSVSSGNPASLSARRVGTR